MYYYSLFFWIVWFALIPVVLKWASLGSELISIVIYSFLGLALYALIPSVAAIILDKIEDNRYGDQKMRDDNRKRFSKVQYLTRKYRYIKLKVKENIINSDIDRDDKIFLLETLHGCTPEEASQLVGAAKK